MIAGSRFVSVVAASSLQIPCNFSTKSKANINNAGPIYGVWIKTDANFGASPNNVIYNSSLAVNTYPMNITGNLNQMNCTTLFSNLTTSYTDVYYFRMENSSYRATASCDPLQINVRDSLTPTIEISGATKEAESVNVTCSASNPCPHFPPNLSWSLQRDSRAITQENTDGTLTTTLQETITLSDTHDRNNITCTATYPVNGGQGVKTVETAVTLNVSYMPKDTSASISPPGVVSAGSCVNLTCRSRARPPVSRFTWFKTSKDGPVNVSEGDVYSFNATEGGVYYCMATNDLGSQKSSEIHLTIEGCVPWRAVVGGIIAIAALVCVVVAIWQLKLRHQTQSPTGQDPAPQEPARPAEENIHYGEINFSSLRAGARTNLVQDRQQQDTVYAEVKVPGTDTWMSDGAEDLYAQVKGKVSSWTSFITQVFYYYRERFLW
uniref:sialic acid-binding Ig-like lectin 13 n=1 Tax=Monopterus albus TaxID=43700 RepID=UPI0009B31F97|nr:sialic acid-binding Ig-like lectin 13 [Monopterus albus]